jgi:hypothetical protein
MIGPVSALHGSHLQRCPEHHSLAEVNETHVPKKRNSRTSSHVTSLRIETGLPVSQSAGPERIGIQRAAARRRRRGRLQRRLLRLRRRRSPTSPPQSSAATVSAGLEGVVSTVVKLPTHPRNPDVDRPVVGIDVSLWRLLR